MRKTFHFLIHLKKLVYLDIWFLKKESYKSSTGFHYFHHLQDNWILCSCWWHTMFLTWHCLRWRGGRLSAGSLWLCSWLGGEWPQTRGSGLTCWVCAAFSSASTWLVTPKSREQDHKSLGAMLAFMILPLLYSTSPGKGNWICINNGLKKLNVNYYFTLRNFSLFLKV